MIRGLLIVLALSASAWAEPFSIESLRPWSVNSSGGSKVSIPATLSHPGATLWTSFPAETSPAELDGDQLVFRVRPKLANGFGVVRVVGTNGISLPKLIAIDPFPTVSPGKTNTTPDRALLLRPPCAVELAIEGSGSRWFSVDLKKNATLGIEAVAQRWGSPLDPFLRVLAPSGQQVAIADETAGLGIDAGLRIKVTQAGRHLIELRDSAFSGGKNERVRLRIGDFTPARVAPAFPTNLVPALETDTPILRLPTQADAVTRVAIPSVVSGVLDRPGRSYLLEIKGEKDRWVRVAAASRALGSPGDLAVSLISSSGKLLSELDATRADDGSFSYKFPETGTYRLAVRELNRGGGDGYVFRLSLRSGRGDADFQVDRHTADASPGSTLELKIAINRRNFDIPVAFRAVGLPEGFTCAPANVDAKAKEASLKISVPPSAAPGTLIHFGLVAEMEIDSVKTTEGVRTRTALGKTWPAVLFPPTGMDGVIALGIRAK